MNSGKLTHLIYTSMAAPQFDATQLEPLLKQARDNNQRIAVTGMLLYSDGNFFQVLEGEEPLLFKLFEIISTDSRHRKVVKILQEPIARRAFSDWSMGFAEVDPSEFQQVEGLNDFFQRGQSFVALKQGRAKRLLSAFVDGRWRARLGGTTS